MIGSGRIDLCDWFSPWGTARGLTGVRIPRVYASFHTAHASPVYTTQRACTPRRALFAAARHTTPYMALAALATPCVVDLRTGLNIRTLLAEVQAIAPHGAAPVTSLIPEVPTWADRPLELRFGTAILERYTALSGERAYRNVFVDLMHQLMATPACIIHTIICESALNPSEYAHELEMTLDDANAHVDDAVKALAELIKRRKELVVLKISHAGISAQCVGVLFNALAQSTVAELTLASVSTIGDAHTGTGAAADTPSPIASGLAQLFSAITPLHTCKVNHTLRLTMPDVEALSSAFYVNQHLRILDLSYAPLTDYGDYPPRPAVAIVAALAAGVRRNRRMIAFSWNADRAPFDREYTGVKNPWYYYKPHVRHITRMRVLCQSGRARATDGSNSNTTAWLCETAPLWVVDDVCRMLRY